MMVVVVVVVCSVAGQIRERWRKGSVAVGAARGRFGGRGPSKSRSKRGVRRSRLEEERGERETREEAGRRQDKLESVWCVSCVSE